MQISRRKNARPCAWYMIFIFFRQKSHFKSILKSTQREIPSVDDAIEVWATLHDRFYFNIEQYTGRINASSFHSDVLLESTENRRLGGEINGPNLKGLLVNVKVVHFIVIYILIIKSKFNFEMNMWLDLKANQSVEGMWKPTQYNQRDYYPEMPLEVASTVRDSIGLDKRLQIEQTFEYGAWKEIKLNYFCANFTDPNNLIMRERATQLEAIFACRGTKSKTELTVKLEHY